MNNILEEDLDFVVGMSLDVILDDVNINGSDKAKNFISSVEEYQGKLKVEDFFIFFDHIKKVDLKQMNKKYGEILHTYMNYYGKWKVPYYSRDIRNVKNYDEMLVNLIGSYANSFLVHFFSKLFKKVEVSEAVQTIIETEIREYYKENKEEIMKSYERYIKEMKEIHEMMYM